MTTAERNRNRALSVARSAARSGDEASAAAWLTIAHGFAEPSRRQLDAHARAILQGKTAGVIPGQLDITGRAAA